MTKANFFWEYDLKYSRWGEYLKKEAEQGGFINETNSFCPHYKEKITDGQLEKLAAYNLDTVLASHGVDLKQLSLTEQNGRGIVPLFGQRTHKLAKMIYSFYNTYCFDDPVDPEKKCPERVNKRQYFSYSNSRDVRHYCHLLIEKEAKFAALAKAIMEDAGANGTIYEVGCGISTFSLACLMLGVKKVVASDVREEPVEKTRALASEFGVNFECLVMDAEGTLDSKLTEDDLLVAGNPASRLRNWAGKHVFAASLLKRALLSNGRARNFEECFEEGFDGQPAPYQTDYIGAEVMYIPTNLPLDHCIEFIRKK